MIFRLLSTPLLLLGVAGAAWYYYTDNKNTIQNLTSQNERLTVAYQDCQVAFDDLVHQKEIVEKNRDEFERKAKKAEQEQSDLFAKIRKHDLTSLTYQKPGLIEKRINNATKEAFESLESITAD